MRLLHACCAGACCRRAKLSPRRCCREELLGIVQALCSALGTSSAASLPARMAELQKQTAAQPRLDRFVSDVCEVCGH